VGGTQTCGPGLHDIGRRRGTWEAMDEPEKWKKKVKDPGGDYEIEFISDKGRGAMIYESLLFHVFIYSRGVARKGRDGGCKIPGYE